MSKLSDFMSQVDPSKKYLASDLVTEVNFMRRELARLRKVIGENGSVEHFVNGAQEMDRTTPYFQNYTNLLGRYATYHKQLASYLPKDTATQGDELDEFIKELRG